MLNVKTKKRSELKSFFKRRNIPTEDNFSDLIDSFISYADDGFSKVQGNPLAIEAVGEPLSQKRVLSFFSSFSNSAESWTICLNPRTEEDDLDTSNTGFSINDLNNNSRLFIEQNSGLIGVGTISPEADLDVNGFVKADGLAIANMITTPVQESPDTNLKVRTDGGPTLFGGSIKAEKNIEVKKDLSVGGQLTVAGKITSDVWHRVEFKKPGDNAMVDTGWIHYNEVLDPTKHQLYNYGEYYKDAMGFVHLRGLVRSPLNQHPPVDGNIVSDRAGVDQHPFEPVCTILTLPEGYRPKFCEVHAQISYRIIYSRKHNGWGEQTRIDILPSGEVRLVVGYSPWVSLDGISFFAADEE